MQTLKERAEKLADDLRFGHYNMATAISMIRELAEALNTRPAAPVGGLEAISFQRLHPRAGWVDCMADDVAHYKSVGQAIREGVDRSQAEAIIAGRDAVIETQTDSIDKLERKVQHWQDEHEKLETQLAAGTVTFHLEWIAGARPPVHPEPMNGSQSFASFDKAIDFMHRLAADAQFVSLIERTTIKSDRSSEARAALEAQP